VYRGKRFMEAAAIVVNAVAELEPPVLAAIAEGRCVPGRRAPTIYPIGPVLSFKPPGDQPHECLRWLDAQPPASVVLLCFGSMDGSFPSPQVREIADGLERSGYRFLWVLRGPPPAGSPYPTDADAQELLPEGFLERTKDRGLVWPKWAPQKDILEHPAAGGFVTHCGWNSILESLWRADGAVAAVRGAAPERVRARVRDGRRCEHGGGQEAGQLRGGRGAGARGAEPDGRRVGVGEEGAGQGHGGQGRKAVEDGGSSDVSMKKVAREICDRHKMQGGEVAGVMRRD